MNVILVDDEINALELFQSECADFEDIRITGCYTDPQAALEQADVQQTDIAVLDIEMPGMNGIELGRRLKEKNDRIILIYVSAYDSYAMDAYRLHAPVYLEKPYGKSDLRYAFNTAARLISEYTELEKGQPKVFARTFGQFDLFVDGRRVHFHNKKSKELLAYLIDRRGAEVTNGQAITILWENAVNDIAYQSKLRRVMKDLKDTLSEAGISQLLVTHYSSRAVDCKCFSCDYYWLLEGDKEAANGYTGEYMSEYSWAEDTVAELFRICGR